MGWGSGSFSGSLWTSSSFRGRAVGNHHRATQLSSIVDVSWSFLLPYLQDPSSGRGIVSHGRQTVPNSLVNCLANIPCVSVMPRAWDPDRIIHSLKVVSQSLRSDDDRSIPFGGGIATRSIRSRGSKWGLVVLQSFLGLT